MKVARETISEIRLPVCPESAMERLGKNILGGRNGERKSF